MGNGEMEIRNGEIRTIRGPKQSSAFGPQAAGGQQQTTASVSGNYADTGEIPDSQCIFISRYSL